jgi:hypothetical protein
MNQKSTVHENRYGTSSVLQLIFYWLIAMIPMTWGVVMTLWKALALFKS